MAALFISIVIRIKDIGSDMLATPPRISYWAIASLILGLAFYIPLATGLLAILTGLRATSLIRNSSGALLGRGIAIAGVSLGVVHAVVWGLVLFAGLTYTVGVGERAVVVRDGRADRVEESGLHYKVPLIEHVERFPTDQIFLFESRSSDLMFSSRQFGSVEYQVLWLACDPARMYEKMGHFRQSTVETVLPVAVNGRLRPAALSSVSAEEMMRDGHLSLHLEEEISTEIKNRGLCLKSFQFISEKNSAKSH